MKCISISYTIIILFLLLHSPILCQTHETDSISAASVELGEAVIRASRVNIRLKEMPASVSLISSSFIEENDIGSLTDISAVAPNLFMPDYGSKLTSPVYIRGVGSRINAPSVGLYVDHIPYFEKSAFNFDFFDVERIEVLRGPQGTLHGRNTMGGIINVFTLSPVNYQGSRFEVTAGNYGVYGINGSHYGRTGENMAFSLSASFRHNNGFYTNGYSGEQVDRLNSGGLRARFVWNITEKLSVENIAGVEISRQGGYPYALFNDSLNRAENISYNQYSYYNRNLFSDALVIRKKWNRSEIMAVSSYQLLDDLQKIDQDFTADSLYFVSQTQLQHMLSQEITVRSAAAGKYSWLFGTYGFYQAFDNSVNSNMYATHMELLKQYDHRITGFALFHQSSVNNLFVKNLTLTAGIRIDLEKDVLQYNYDMMAEGPQVNLADTVYPALRSVEILPKLALNYKLNRNNFYVVIAKGYKTGGFNSTFERPEDLTFDPEYSWNYEAGAKIALLPEWIYGDFALFYIDWKNQQIYQTVPSGRGSMLKNAGHSASKGVEAAVRTLPLRGMELMLTYGYTHAVFRRYVADTVTNYSGSFIPYVPRHTLALMFNKTFMLQGSSFLNAIKLNLLYRGAGETWWNEKNSHKQGFYGLFDAKLSFLKQPVQLDLWCRNLFNVKYEAFYFEALGNKYVQTGKPLQFGISLILKPGYGKE